MFDAHNALLSICAALGAGTLLIALSRRLKLPTIVFLLAGGMWLGPEYVGLIQPEALGPMLKLVVSLAVSLILFEGGLTLDLHGFLSSSGVIRRLLTAGVLITWLGTTLAAKVVYPVLPWSFCLLASSLVIVTGPTVIMPLLKRINVQPRLHHILHWEGVLIDAIGVFIALLCFELVVAGEGWGALQNLGARVFLGLLFGVVGGWSIYLLIRWRVVPESIVNAFTLAAAVAIFGAAEAFVEEGGLLAVVVAGLVLGWKKPVELKQIRQFKGEVTDLLIALLFLLLSARLRIEQFENFGTHGLWLVGAVIFLVRPLNVLVSTWGSDLSWRERTFLSWIAPRGIVAASMTSLFALELTRRDAGYAPGFLESFVYSTIVATVVLQGFTAGIVARVLGLARPKPDGWLLLGAGPFARRVAQFIRSRAEVPVVLIDRDAQHVTDAREAGLDAIREDALHPEIVANHPELQRMGYLLALTDNSDLNALACTRWVEALGREHVFGWRSARDHAEERADAHHEGVWRDLPRPSELSGELLRGESELLEWDGAGEPDGHALPLISAKRGRVLAESFAPGIAGREKAFTLLLRRHGGFLARSLERGLLVDLDPDDPPLPFATLLNTAGREDPKFPIARLQGELEAREQLVSSMIGRGVAVPHTYVPELKQHVCILGRRPPRGDMAGAASDVPVLIFLLLSPPADPQGHLATLAEIARACLQDTVRKELLEARDLRDVLTLLRDHAEWGR